MARTKTGEAIRPERRSGRELRALKTLRSESRTAKDMDTWRRCKGVLAYIRGKSVIAIAESYDVTRGSVNRWIQWYDAEGASGLRPIPRLGAAPRLNASEKARLALLVESGPQESGFKTGVWTGPMIGKLIEKVFGVRYHTHHIPRLLHSMGFSVQRPRKRLAKADLEAQEYWLRVRLPAIKKKPTPAEVS